MKLRYKIIATKKEGEFVKLVIVKDDAIKEKENFNVMEAMENMDTMLKQVQKSFMQNFSQDTITIPYEEYKEYGYKIDDIVCVDVTLEKS